MPTTVISINAHACTRIFVNLLKAIAPYMYLWICQFGYTTAWWWIIEINLADGTKGKRGINLDGLCPCFLKQKWGGFGGHVPPLHPWGSKVWGECPPWFAPMCRGGGDALLGSKFDWGLLLCIWGGLLAEYLMGIVGGGFDQWVFMDALGGWGSGFRFCYSLYLY